MMRHAIAITTAVTQSPTNPQANVRVSALSVFSDNTWDFTAEIGNKSLTISDRAINWKFKVTQERDSLDPAYETMLLALKQLAYAMLFLVQPRKCVFVIRVITRLKTFVQFLSKGEHPIYRFQDVLETDLERYIERRKQRFDGKGEVNARTLLLQLLYLNKLFDYREYMSDYLLFRPTGDKTPAQMIGCRIDQRLKTKAIPDDELKAMIDVAIDYIQNQSVLMFKCLEEYNLFAQRVGLKAIKRSRKWHYIEDHFFSFREDYRSSAELNASLVRLRTACFIIIAFCTGMRMSELLATRRGSISQQWDANHGTFYWLRSLLFKTQRTNSGSPRSWMCGRVAAEAVFVMERMGELLGAHSETKYLFIKFQHFTLLERTDHRIKFKCLSVTTAQSNLKAFCAFHQLCKSIHTHRLRRSFARNIIRYSTTPILALKDHLKHWSLYMTEWYVGLDNEMIEELEAERLVLSMELMEKICTQPVGGAGGRRWSKELDQRIADGTLPRKFRGKAGIEYRQEIIISLHESGMVASRCGTFTTCIFLPEGARCTTGKRPVVNLCNPYDCIHSYILPENVPFYRQKLADSERLFNALTEEAKSGPVGQFYQREMRKARRALEPFEK